MKVTIALGYEHLKVPTQTGGKFLSFLPIEGLHFLRFGTVRLGERAV